ncbi:MAG: RC-LH1 core complex protein PufX [Pseudomonadota bacterium]
MSDKYYDESRATNLTFWVTGQMLKGAGCAAAFLLTVGVVLWAIWGVGLLLPAESKQAPSPYGALAQPLVPAFA